MLQSVLCMGPERMARLGAFFKLQVFKKGDGFHRALMLVE